MVKIIKIDLNFKSHFYMCYSNIIIYCLPVGRSWRRKLEVVRVNQTKLYNGVNTLKWRSHYSWYHQWNGAYMKLYFSIFRTHCRVHENRRQMMQNSDEQCGAPKNIPPPKKKPYLHINLIWCRFIFFSETITLMEMLYMTNRRRKTCATFEGDISSTITGSTSISTSTRSWK